MRALPVVLPVSFVLTPEALVVATGGGAVLEAACDHAVVALETDGIDPMSRIGWSVLVQGEATIVRGPGELADAPASAWRPGEIRAPSASSRSASIW